MANREVDDAALAALQAALEAAEARNVVLGSEVERLTALVASLEARLGQSSKNSSIPPSQDSPKSRAERRAEAREKAKSAAKGEKRSRGKQPGALGAHLPMSGTPDDVVPHEPERCGDCGADLADAPVEGFSRRQVFDTADPVIVCVEHRSVRKRCSCGKLSAGAFPREARAPACYGPNIRAAALYLLHGQHLSTERCAQAMSEMLGAKVSVGFVVALAAEAAGELGPFLAEVATRLISSPVVHVDETTDQVRTDTWWFHVCANDLYTLLYASPTRGKDAPDKAGVLGKFTGVMMHDRLAMYFKYTDAAHSVCGAHLVRDLAAAGVRWNQTWAGEMTALLTETNKACHQARAEGRSRLDRDVLGGFLSSYDALVEVGLAANPEPANRERNYLERKSYNIAVALRDRRAEATRFAVDLSLPFTNNQGERSLRMAKLHRKISGCFQADESARHFAAIRSYLGTARKHGVGGLDVLGRLFRDDVWMPPSTA